MEMIESGLKYLIFDVVLQQPHSKVHSTWSLVFAAYQVLIILLHTLTQILWFSVLQYGVKLQFCETKKKPIMSNKVSKFSLRIITFSSWFLQNESLNPRFICQEHLTNIFILCALLWISQFHRRPCGAAKRHAARWDQRCTQTNQVCWYISWHPRPRQVGILYPFWWVMPLIPPTSLPLIKQLQDFFFLRSAHCFQMWNERGGEGGGWEGSRSTQKTEDRKQSLYFSWRF